MPKVNLIKLGNDGLSDGKIESSANSFIQNNASR